MKRFAASVLWISLCLLWITGGASVFAPDCSWEGGQAGYGIVAQVGGLAHKGENGCNKTGYQADRLSIDSQQQQTISVMRHSLSLFEHAPQARVPMGEHVDLSARLRTSAGISGSADPALSLETLCFTGHQPANYLFTGGSVDYYIYALRKIVI